MEVTARHARDRASLSLSYALTFAELEAGGERYTPRFERRHLLEGSAALPLGERGMISGRLSWATGQPYTPVGEAGRSGDVAHNSARLPGYFRLDVAARRDFVRRWWGREVTLTPYLSVINVLNTRNVLFAETQQPFGDPSRLAYTPQLPIFPTLGLEWTF